MSYHLTPITKGELGEFSKIREEFEELQDAVEQNINILILCELADLTGAIEAYVEKRGMTLKDLLEMKDVTIRAFKSGHRSQNIVK